MNTQANLGWKRWMGMLAVLALAAGTLSGAAYLKFDGVDGESTAAGHEGEIDVLSWSWGVSNSGSSSGGGGRAVFQDITISKPLDKSSPKLALACASGKNVESVMLTVRRPAGDSDPVWLTIELENVLVSSVQTAGSRGDPAGSESLSLNFEKIKITYVPQSSGEPVVMTWDVVNNRE